MPPRRKLDQSFADIVSEPVAPAPPQKIESASESDNAVHVNGDTGKPARKPHISFYCSLAVQRAVKQIALDRNVRPHDIYVEGLRGVMAAHGLDFDKLNES